MGRSTPRSHLALSPTLSPREELRAASSAVVAVDTTFPPRMSQRNLLARRQLGPVCVAANHPTGCELPHPGLQFQRGHDGRTLDRPTTINLPLPVFECSMARGPSHPFADNLTHVISDTEASSSRSRSQRLEAPPQCKLFSSDDWLLHASWTIHSYRILSTKLRHAFRKRTAGSIPAL